MTSLNLFSTRLGSMPGRGAKVHAMISRARETAHSYLTAIRISNEVLYT